MLKPCVSSPITAAALVYLLYYEICMPNTVLVQLSVLRWLENFCMFNNMNLSLSYRSGYINLMLMPELIKLL